MSYPEEQDQNDEKNEPRQGSENDQSDTDQIDEALEETFPASDPPAFHREQREGGKHGR